MSRTMMQHHKELGLSFNISDNLQSLCVPLYMIFRLQTTGYFEYHLPTKVDGSQFFQRLNLVQEQ